MIQFENNRFTIQMKDATYQFQVLSSGHLEHVYFGATVEGNGHSLKQYPQFASFVSNLYGSDLQIEARCMEFSTFGNPDLRTPSLDVLFSDGSNLTQLLYDSYTITKGKEKTKGTPTMFGEDVEVLQVVLKDQKRKLKVILEYSVLEEVNTLSKKMIVCNEDEQIVQLLRVNSSTIDFYDHDFTVGYLQGTWGKERKLREEILGYGSKSIQSMRGASSHAYNPAFYLKKEGCNEVQGEVFGFNFIYSGNFLNHLESDQFGKCRVQTGIHPQNFRTELAKEECFTAPEVVITYSNHGLHKMSQQFHEVILDHIMTSMYARKARPILMNNWEATYFDFTKDKLVELASVGSSMGIELFVLDDGWFGERHSDATSLGDWFVNERKMQGDLGSFVDELQKLGLQFGLWMEPEMINKDSNLYQAHPDWLLQHPFYESSPGRNQYVLDCSLQEVQEYLIERISYYVEHFNLEYIKWDSNRNLSEVFSVHRTPNQQGSLYHDHIQGIYHILETITTKHPRLLIEHCSGGGGRYDLGMLYYAPQIWCSDDSDAIERCSIQYGTSLFYPHSSMGAHVSFGHNHQTGRTTDFNTRDVVARAGTYGYEIDFTKCDQEELNLMKEAIQDYKNKREVLQLQKYIRCSKNEDNVVGWFQGTAEEGYLTCVQKRARVHKKAARIKVPFLEQEMYLCNGEEVHGSWFMNHGIELPYLNGDGQSIVYHIKKK